MYRYLSFGSLFCLFAFGTGCQKSQKMAWPVMPPIPVTALRVETQTIPANFDYLGVGASSHRVELRARVDGYLTSIDYIEGSLVKQGDPMFTLDKRPFCANVAAAKGTLTRQQAYFWNTEQTKARMLSLRSQNAISQRDLDQALTDELSAKANVETAAADLAQAELNLSFASITAPITGIAGEANYREGALISSGKQSPLSTMYVLDPIWVNFSITEREMLQFNQESKLGLLKWPENMSFQIEAQLSDGTVIPTQGAVGFTNPAIDQTTGTRMVRAVIPNPEGLILPGQFVKVIVKGATRPNAILVPQTAVIQGKKGPFIYLIEEGKVRAQTVKAGAWYRDYWIIHEGLKVGDLVVTLGVSKIQNGSAVTIQTMLPSLTFSTGK